MPVIKTIPLALASGVTVGIDVTSSYYGIDIADYVALGLDFSYTLGAGATGKVYLKVYGCNDSAYSTNTKFHILTYEYDVSETNGHISLRCMEFRNMAIKVINNTNSPIVFTSSIIGVRLT